MQLTPVAVLRSPFKQKFAIPRQPGLAPAALSTIEFYAEFNDANSLRGIGQFSHLWLIFVFHENADKGWSPLVRPPRLGGNQKMGVFATRSTFRPNPIGMSVVELVDWQHKNGVLTITVKGADLLDGTPILDIKPYIPYSDAHPDASGGFASDAPQPLLSVTFSQQAQAQLQTTSKKYASIQALIEQVLAQDPRPAYKKSQGEIQEYGMTLYDLNIRWRCSENQAEVIGISQIAE
ncbi:tRNA (N6-threonylcarbamoyladenosine(37)-N6)-methyltransferase TrmO [Neptunicella marina]|uniref:tRNA (N6-threonylcarbamoyladenosine(37)-N6)-methyltransferase TrmO n=1 Tax=Neptunicella marina TaxID=2125989 RepID=A0A8J6IVL4_9ALTE|nr:tRNA (N6-threonylcarbamoyladenosine(37)-N6)-methyltransferase TrmO [Neptunicella marina]MBC3766406.1 tRNA (N6-threonylcarbamoyladenosine(37)-N6)-methyltransferase TrmO [Neptunicella marina]